MRCKTEAINSAVGTVWREVSRLEDELRKAEDKIKWLGGALRYHGLEGQSAPDERDARIDKLLQQAEHAELKLARTEEEFRKLSRELLDTKRELNRIDALREHAECESLREKNWNEKLREEKADLIGSLNATKVQPELREQLEVAQKDLNTMAVQIRNYMDETARLMEERDELKKKFATAVRSLSESEKALAFYEGLAAKQAGTGETRVSIPISAMSGIYVLWNPNDLLCPGSVGYNSLEKIRTVWERRFNRDTRIARLVWVES